MTYLCEESLYNFNFWSGAKPVAELLRYDEFETIEDLLEEIFDGTTPTETDINDFFWFESDCIAEALGYDDFEEMLLERTGAEE